LCLVRGPGKDNCINITSAQRAFARYAANSLCCVSHSIGHVIPAPCGLRDGKQRERRGRYSSSMIFRKPRPLGSGPDRTQAPHRTHQPFTFCLGDMDSFQEGTFYASTINDPH
jgi:hypothetical protein